MATLLVSHSAFLDHAVPPGHPERPDRIRAIERALSATPFAPLLREAAPEGTLDQVMLVHPESHVERIRGLLPKTGFARIDSDTLLSPGSWEAALRAVGASIAAVDAVTTGRARNAFAAHRPPGHHAERTTAMGFCIFNNAAIAARHAQLAHGAERVAIVDFDVHHGNGTQEIFWSDPSVLYASTHQMPLYPGTGARGETGEHGTIVNAPLAPGAGGAAFREAMEARILPAVKRFRPDLLVVSAGFDAHADDPLAQLNLVEDDFAWVTHRLMDVADAACGGRIVSVLEGGYDLEALALSAAAHVGALMGIADDA